MITKKIKRNMLYVGVIIIFIIIYLIYPRQLNMDESSILSITMNYTENNIMRKIKTADDKTIHKMVENLNTITYLKLSYGLDVGLVGYDLEIIDNKGNIKIININYDDTIKVQSNGRYKLKDGISIKIYEKLLDIYKSNKSNFSVIS